MHLFITSVRQKEDRLIIDEPRVVHQVRNVLRMQPGEIFEVQEVQQDTSTRQQVQLEKASKTQLELTGLSVQSETKKQEPICLAVALPNKTDKLTMIVQKLTEVGIDKIIFRPSQRSQLRSLEPKTLERLEKIVLEATEQSQRRFLPEITFVPHFAQAVSAPHSRCLFDWDGKSTKKVKYTGGIIGPEGGFTDEEKAYFTSLAIDTVALGSTILRMETATIIGGWLLVQR